MWCCNAYVYLFSAIFARERYTLVQNSFKSFPETGLWTWRSRVLNPSSPQLHALLNIPNPFLFILLVSFLTAGQKKHRWRHAVIEVLAWCSSGSILCGPRNRLHVRGPLFCRQKTIHECFDEVSCAFLRQEKRKRTKKRLWPDFVPGDALRPWAESRVYSGAAWISPLWQMGFVGRCLSFFFVFLDCLSAAVPFKTNFNND